MVFKITKNFFIGNNKKKLRKTKISKVNTNFSDLDDAKIMDDAFCKKIIELMCNEIYTNGWENKETLTTYFEKYAFKSLKPLIIRHQAFYYVWCKNLKRVDNFRKYLISTKDDELKKCDDALYELKKNTIKFQNKKLDINSSMNLPKNEFVKTLLADINRMSSENSTYQYVLLRLYEYCKMFPDKFTYYQEDPHLLEVLTENKSINLDDDTFYKKTELLRDTYQNRNVLPELLGKRLNEINALTEEKFKLWIENNKDFDTDKKQSYQVLLANNQRFHLLISIVPHWFEIESLRTFGGKILLSITSSDKLQVFFNKLIDLIIKEIKEQIPEK